MVNQITQFFELGLSQIHARLSFLQVSSAKDFGKNRNTSIFDTTILAVMFYSIGKNKAILEADLCGHGTKNPDAETEEGKRGNIL